ncbi:MAG: hypothetical protein KGJ84_13780 [Elusimicrobia bacterium]|nr:hypothetical protein [Elusimicrobiota bacterium]
MEHLAEIDKRDLPSKRMRVSLYEFCVHHLRLSEEAAYRRIRAARAIRKFPPISNLLREGKLTFESVALLHPFLNDPDAAVLVTRCIGLRKWQVQSLLAGRQTEKPRPDVIRVCGPVLDQKKARTMDDSPSFFSTSAGAAPAPSAAPLSPTPASSSPNTAPRPHSIRVSFSADAEFHRLMLRARALLRHKYPDGRLEGVLKDALVALLKRKDRGFGWTKVRP